MTDAGRELARRVPGSGEDRLRGRKRLETQPSAQPELKNLQLIHEPKPAPLTCEGPEEMGRDAKQPTGATEDYATSRPGASFRVKGEISGNEDLHIEGTVEGLIQLDEGKLTLRFSAGDGVTGLLQRRWRSQGG